METGIIIAVAVVVLVVIVVIIKTAVVVPQQSAYVVENLGKFSRTLVAGFHILVPFIERIAYKHTLKEQAIDVEEQICITADNVQVGVDGVLYLQVMDARNDLRHRRVSVRHRATRADHVAERNRQDRA